MSESRDMDAPVTRRELHETLELWGGALEARLESRIVVSLERRIVALFEMFEARFMSELRSHVQGALEDVRGRVSAIDDKYKDLPARVGRLEAKVFPPRKPRRRRAS